MDHITEVSSQVTDLMRKAQHLVMSRNMLDSLSVADESCDISVEVSQNILTVNECVILKLTVIEGSLGVIKEHLQKLLLPSRYEKEAKLSDSILR